MPSPDAVFEAVREAASRPVWSRGVELVRAKAVTAERVTDSEALLRVLEPGTALARTVTLDLAGPAWDCDCASDADPCLHVAAAVIAWRRAAEAGEPLPTAAAVGAGRLRYVLSRPGAVRTRTGAPPAVDNGPVKKAAGFERSRNRGAGAPGPAADRGAAPASGSAEPSGLVLERRVVTEGADESLLSVRLRALAAGRVDGPRVLAGEIDLALDDALDDPRGGSLSRAALTRLLPLLARCDDVRLDGTPLQIDLEPLAPEGVVEDHAQGFRLRVDLLPGVTERIGEGFALCGTTLRPLRETRLTGRELAELPAGRVIPFDRAAELAGETLPDLARRIPVDVRTDRLPRVARGEPPRIRVEVRRSGDSLVLRADLVYGDPPRARVEGGRLVGLAGAVPVRDEAAERALARRVQGELALPVGAEVVLDGEAAIEAASRLAGFAGEIAGDAHRTFTRAAPLVPQGSAGEARLELWFEPADAAAGAPPRRAVRVDAARVLRTWEAGGSLVPLEGGGLAPLPADWLARFGREAAALLEQRRADGTLPRCALPDAARLAGALGVPEPGGFDALRALASDFEAIPTAVLPPDLRAHLRPYQRAAVDWLCFLRDAELGALLADDMGLGKTVELLCALRGRALVVCPTSVLRQWAEEVQRFRPALSVCVHHGAERRLDPAAAVTLTSYAILRLDAERLRATTWDTVVLDEAQAIKNPDSQVARAARALQARWRVALTGTPIENRLEELWSQLDFANPGLLGSLASFQARWARPIAAGEPGVAEALRRRIRPFVLRRTKRAVAPELPPRTERVLRCELDAEERVVYDAVRAAARRDVAERLAAGASPLAALEALLRLRQAACHRGLVPGQRAERSSKVDLLVEVLETAVAEGHKALVFSQWTSLLDRVEPHLRAAGVAWTRLDGATRDRAAVVARFQAADGPPVLLISLQAGGTGLNLTAADHVFLLDPWWNPAVEDQAADRAHRIGQTQPVEIHRLVAAETVEERVLELQQRKRGLADAALADAATAAALTRDDLLALLA
jgi:superfamily II DNA or RNA helicase